MNLALDHFADNPVIDELVVWPPRAQQIRSLRAASSMFRKPFIEAELEDGTRFQRQFPREGFAGYWAEAVVILDTLTEIELVSDFRFTPLRDADGFAREVLGVRDDCLAEAEKMYREGMYEQYLMQFGADSKPLPEAVDAMLADARRRLRAS